jgi:phage-related tail protein
MTTDTPVQLSKDLDALIDRFGKMAMRHGGALGDDLKDQAGSLKDILSDLNFAIEKQEERDREDEALERHSPYGRMSSQSSENFAGICEHLRNAAE